jgi:hypothetical protein
MLVFVLPSATTWLQLIPVALWVALPHLETYRGLSGIDSALYVLLAVTLLKDEVHGRRWGWVMAISGVLFAFIGKVGYEIVTGGTIFVNSGASHMIPVPLAHCVGAAVGMIVGLMRIPNWLHTPWRDLSGRESAGGRHAHHYRRSRLSCMPSVVVARSERYMYLTSCWRDIQK